MNQRTSQQQQRQGGNAKQSQQQESAPKRPFNELRMGGLKAVIWENDTRNGSMFSVQLIRVYKDERDQWQETHSLGVDDLLAAAKLLDMAHSAIVEEQRARTGNRQSTAA